MPMLTEREYKEQIRILNNVCTEYKEKSCNFERKCKRLESKIKKLEAENFNLKIKNREYRRKMNKIIKIWRESEE